MTTMHQAIDQMVQFGLPPPPMDKVFPDGKIIRWDWQKPNDKRCWCKLHEYISPKSGKQYISGSFGCWGNLDTQNIVASTDGLDANEVKKVWEQQALARAAQDAEREQLKQRAELVARRLWDKASRTGHSPYLERKSLGEFNAQPESFRFLQDGSLVVPAIRYDHKADLGQQPLIGVQTIHPDGSKLFNKGCAKQGSACRIGLPPQPKQHIIFCEGFATGLTLRLATRRNYPIIVCWDAGNLPFVTEIFRELYPHNPFIVAADDDWKTYKKDSITGRMYPDNPGLTMAYEAAKIAGSNSVYTRPIFNGLPPGVARHSSWTDFNDLHQQAGLEAVSTSILATIYHWETLK